MKSLAALVVLSAIPFAAMKASSNDALPDQVTVRLLGPDNQPLPPESVPTVKKSEDEWRRQLGDKTFHVVRAQGTERPFCGTLLDNKKKGVYFCVACDLPLFSSESKFNSGTGWPSFFQPFAKENVAEIADNSHGMERIEIRCARCGGHLGHVFPDGPAPTHLRYCLNSESLTFRETK